MVVDNVASQIATSSGSAADDPSKKGKAKEGKKVCSCAPHILVNNCRGPLSQVPEKRPEVRFIEVSDIPGITISSRFQKYLSAKRIKVDHPNGSSQDTRSGM